MEFIFGLIVGLVAGALVGAKHKPRVDAATDRAQAEINRFKK